MCDQQRGAKVHNCKILLPSTFKRDSMNQWVFKSVFLIVSLSADKLMKLKTKKNIQLLFMKISGNRHCLNLYLVCFVAQFNPPPPPLRLVSLYFFHASVAISLLYGCVLLARPRLKSSPLPVNEHTHSLMQMPKQAHTGVLV